jgi:hypothetical protein
MNCPSRVLSWTTGRRQPLTPTAPSTCASNWSPSAHSTCRVPNCRMNYAPAGANPSRVPWSDATEKAHAPVIGHDETSHWACRQYALCLCWSTAVFMFLWSVQKGGQVLQLSGKREIMLWKRDINEISWWILWIPSSLHFAASINKQALLIYPGNHRVPLFHMHMHKIVCHNQEERWTSDKVSTMTKSAHITFHWTK